MAQPLELKKLKSNCKALSSLTKLLMGGTIDNNELVHIKIQLSDNAEQGFKLDLKIQTIDYNA